MPSRFLLAFQLMLTVPVFGQMQRNDDIFPRAGNYERRGWTVSPMLTYTLPAFKQYSERLFLGNDSVYDISFQGKGRVSFGIEIGRFQAIDASRIISFVDLNIGAKILRGVEETEAVLAERGAIRTNTLRQQSVFDRSISNLPSRKM